MFLFYFIEVTLFRAGENRRWFLTAYMFLTLQLLQQENRWIFAKNVSLAGTPVVNSGRRAVDTASITPFTTVAGSSSS